MRIVGTRRVLVLGTAISGLMAIVGLPARANLIVNGGFETPAISSSPGFTTYPTGSTTITGWTVVSGNVDLVRTTFYPAFAGTQTLDLDGSAPGAIEQSFTTVAGQVYSLIFHYGNNNGGPVPATATVGVFGLAVPALLSANLTHGTSSTANMDYSPFSAVFTADSTTTRLRFTSTQPAISVGGIVLDEVAVEAVPEPSSLALLFVGGTMLLRRRRALIDGRELPPRVI